MEVEHDYEGKAFPVVTRCCGLCRQPGDGQEAPRYLDAQVVRDEDALLDQQRWQPLDVVVEPLVEVPRSRHG
jgi:hypothetical protein